ncbi:MAG: FAD-dependent monooxygenase, partial [Pseudolabrys sp.]
MEVLIIGAGIGGLTLGLMLHRAGIACRIFEAAPELKAVGVGINI